MFRDAIRGETWRPNGDSLQAIIADLSLTLRGCHEHIKHSIRATFPTIAGWQQSSAQRVLMQESSGLRADIESSTTNPG